MRTDLDHLPLSKRLLLEAIVRIIFEEFETALALSTQPWKKRARILKVILYGSYARGGWVDDPIGGYTSDFDLLVIVDDERLTDFELWEGARDRLMRDHLVTKRLKAPVSLIVHSLADVNDQLTRGRPFFVDIARDGIALYECTRRPLARPGNMLAESAFAEALIHFEEWFPSAIHRFDLARTAIAKGYWKEAAFDLHQVTERLYHCTLLVLKLYSPRSHNLKFLRSQSEAIVPELAEAWPRTDRASRRCFELLYDAYVKARYSPHYTIGEAELRWLVERVTALQALVGAACERHLAR